MTSPLLKVPAYLTKLAGCTNFYVLMRKIYYMGVVPSSIQLFTKWEISFDSENFSTTTSVFLLVSEAQGVQPSSPHIILIPSPPKHIFVRVMSTVLNSQIICLQFPQVALPWSVKEIPVGVVPPSVEAFRKWEDNSDSIQLTDCWHCSAVTNRLSSKADIGTASLYTKSVKTLCGPSLRNTNANCVQKVFCWCVVTSEFLRSRKVAWGVSPHILSQCRVCTNTFLLVWSQHCWTPKLSGYATKMSGPAKQSEVYKGWVVLRSTEAFKNCDKNSGSVHCIDCMPTSRSNNRGPVSKALYGMGSECPKFVKLARGLSHYKVCQCHLCTKIQFAGVMWKSRY